MTREEKQKLYERLLAGRKVPEPPPKPSAEVIPMPDGQALALAKAERTRAAEIDRAFEREKAAADERLRRAQQLVESPQYAQAGARFNRENYFRDSDKDGPCHFHNPGGWA
jgi:hypothetical protein